MRPVPFTCPWIFLQKAKGLRVDDTHLGSPEAAAGFLDAKCDCPCDWNKPWWFTQTAIFSGYAGIIAPRIRSGTSPLNATTFYICFGQPGQTVTGKDAIHDMYWGNPAANTTVFSEANVERRGGSVAARDHWSCSGAGNWTCRYTTTGYR